MYRMTPEQDNSVRQWKISRKEEKAGKKLKSKGCGKKKKGLLYVDPYRAETLLESAEEI
jgi:hypothetical protein